MEPWQHSEGQVPFVVTAYERATKGSVVYLRWRVRDAAGDTNWAHKSLGKVLRDGRGRILEAVAQEAIAAARKKHAELLAAQPLPVRAERLSLAEGMALYLRPDTGKYPAPTAHRKEVERSARYVAAMLGADRTWASIKLEDLRRVWRQRIQELRRDGERGCRGAEITVSRVLTLAAWLRAEGHIGPLACIVPRTWNQDLRTDWRLIAQQATEYAPYQPRHTVEEMRKILAVAAQVDPRFDLLVQLGAEQRLGQVARARRQDLDLDAAPARFRVPGMGHKRGPTLYLTDGQVTAVRRALGGYLAELEATGEDYPLFPQSQLVGGRKGTPHATARHLLRRPVGDRTIGEWFNAAEQLAGIAHVPGRGYYGMRRAGVDGAKAEGISREGLKEHGGWTDSQVPDQIYADREAAAPREEARAVRARIRGEKPGTPST